MAAALLDRAACPPVRAGRPQGGQLAGKNLESRFPTPESLERYLGSVLALTPEPILCCYEADASQCHRRILASYLKEMLGLDVPEWKETSLEQGSLL